MDRLLLVLLVFVGIYVFWIRGLETQIQQRVIELKALEYNIAKEKFIKKEAKIIREIYPKELKVIRKNNELFYPANVGESFAMSNLQLIIRKTANDAHVKLLNTRWGFVETKKGYKVLPITIMVKGNPNNINIFTMKLLYNKKKLLRFKMLKLTRAKKMLVLNAIVVGFKRIKNEEQ